MAKGGTLREFSPDPGITLPEKVVDLAIIGGGINGCGIARDAAGRGLSVFLCEQNDLGGATSSASTKLIHGGLRYLEQYAFRLVREALAEREVLLRSAPHIIRPLRFVLPHHAGLRPWPIIRIGLFLYDHLGGGRTLPGTKSLDLARAPAGVPLKKTYRRAFEYSDCTVDDSRLAMLAARAGTLLGATVETRTRCIAARREHGLWRITVENTRNGKRHDVCARALVNAAGPWVAEVVENIIGRANPVKVRLVKGSHIVVDRLYDHDRAYIFQNGDGRVCFAIPYERDFTLIGTTDEDFTGDASQAHIDAGETAYLLSAVSEYFERPVTRRMIRWSYSGVRPLHDDGSGKAQEATRDYLLDLDAPPDEAPLLSVYGGKITTHRRLAEHAMEKLAPTFPRAGPAWTAKATLPGGDIGPRSFAAWAAEKRAEYAFLDGDLVRRLCASYGTCIDRVLSGVKTPEGLGRKFGAGLSERELEYLVAEEWAETLDDVIWRRSKLGLWLTPAEQAEVARYLRDDQGVEAAAALSHAAQ
jgi:glycerol-3-phosphate dehydrogenase